jgi:hypothetical protein
MGQRSCSQLYQPGDEINVKDGHHKIKFLNSDGGSGCGGYYEGNIKNKRQHGQGKEYISSYFTDFNGKKQTIDIIYYKGNWKDGLMHGRGELFLANHVSYSGNFTRGHQDGECCLTVSVNGVHFETDRTWNNGVLLDGLGTMVYAKKKGGCGVYKGHFKGMKRSGVGKMVRNQTKYEGNWEDDKPCGSGVEVKADGSRYVGEFHNGERHGKGIMTFANEDVVEGNFVCGMVDGKGTRTFKNGNVYDGQFVRGEMEGVGTMTISGHKATYNGQFKKGDLVCGTKSFMKDCGSYDVFDTNGNTMTNYT